MLQLRRLASRALPKVIDPIPSTGRTVYVTGSARSGTTWIAQLVADAIEGRLLFEPMHHASDVHDVPHFPADETLAPATEQAMRRSLQGRVRSERIDRFNGRRLALRRVVKDIRPGLIPAVRAIAPTAPVVYVVRHPLEVALSRQELDEREGDWWDTAGALEEIERLAEGDGPTADLARTGQAALDDDRSPLAPHVVIWCVENALALSSWPMDDAVAFRYGDLVTDPAPVLAEIERVVGAPMTPDGRFRSPSKTSFRDRDQVGKLGKWQDVLPEEESSRLLEITTSFGLDHLFGTDPADCLPPLAQPVGARP